MSRVAAIDCGTNSIRLLVADVTIRDDGTAWLRDIHREMRVVRLGEGVDATGKLSEAALERTRVALADYTAIAVRKGVQNARMVATSATRDATNKADFITMTEQTLGVPAELITGDEEARLSFAGAVADQDPTAGPFLIADIGGGSTELVLGTWDGHNAEVEVAKSVDIGCVRLTERCLPSDPPTPTETEEAAKVAKEVLTAAFEAVPLERTKTFIGVAGTVTTLSAINMDLPSYNPETLHLSQISLEEIRTTTAKLLAMTKQERAALGPMHPGRADVIGGGAIVTRTIAEELATRANVTILTVSEHDILDGIAIALATP